MMKLNDKNRILGRLRLLGILLVPLACLSIVVYLGLYIRPSADDFCFLFGSEDIDHILGSDQRGDMRSTYLSGRLSTTAALLALYPFGETILKLAPLLSITILIFAFTYFYRGVALRLGWNSKFNSYTLAILTTFSLVFSTPILYQTYMWLPGVIVYSFGMAGLIVTLGYLIRNYNSTRIKSVGILFALATITSLFNELLCLIIGLIGLTILIVSLLVHKKLNIRLYAVPATLLLACSLSLAVLMFAPGAVERRELLEISSSSITSTLAQVKGALPWFWNNSIATNPTLTIVFLLSVIYALVCHKSSTVREIFDKHPKLWFTALTILFMATIITAVLVMLVMFHTTGYYPPPRVLSIILLPTTFTVIVLGITIGFLINSNSRSKPQLNIIILVSIILGLFLLLSPLWGRLSALSKEIVHRDSQWVLNEERILSAKRKGIDSVELLPLQIGFNGVPKPATKHFVNQCIALRYDFSTVTAPDVTTGGVY